MLNKASRSIVILLAACGLCLTGCGQGEPIGTETIPTPTPGPDRSRLRLDQLTPLVAKPQPGETQPLPNKAKALVNEGEKLLAGRKFSTATKKFLQAEQLAPNHPRVLHGLGSAYFASNNRTKARDILEQAVRTDPDNLKAQLLLGKIYYADRQYDMAMLVFRKAMKSSAASDDNPATGETLLWLGNLLSRKGYLTAALECFVQLSNNVENHASRYAQTSSLRKLVVRPEGLLILRGRLLVQLGRNAEAADLLETAFEYNRSEVRTAKLLIASLIADGQFARAESLLLEIADQPAQESQIPELAEALCLRANDPAMPSRIADAMRRRKRLNPALAASLARISQKLGGSKEAIEMLESVIADSPSNVKAIGALAVLYAEQGMHEKGLKLLASVLADDPAADEAVRQAVARIAETRTPVDIERSFALVVSRDKTDLQSALYYVAGVLAAARDEPSLAAELYRRSIIGNRKFLPSYLALTDWYLEAGLDDALTRLIQSLTVAAPDNYLSFYIRGRIHFHREDPLLAHKELTEAHRRNESHLPTLRLLAETYRRLGESDEAAETLAKAIVLAPNDEDLYAKLFDLYLSKRQFSKAGAILFRLGRAKGDSPVLLQLKAILAIETGRFETARETILKLRKADPTGRDLAMLEMRLRIAQPGKPLSDKEHQALVSSLKKLIHRRDDGYPKKLLQDLLKRKDKDIAQHLPVWKDLYDQTSGREDIARLYAASLMATGRFAEALPILQELVDNNPASFRWQRRYLDALLKLGKKDEAVLQCRKIQTLMDRRIAILETGPKVDALRAEKFKLYLLADMYDELASFGRRWAASEPDNLSLRQLLVSSMVAGKRYDKAIEMLNEWISAGGEGLTSYRQMKVGILARAKLFDQAEAFAQEWIEQEPEQIPPRQSILAALVSEGEPDRAQQLVDGWLKQLIPPTQPALVGPVETMPATMPSTAPAQPATQPTTIATATQPATQPAQPPAPSQVTRWCMEQSARLLMMRNEYALALGRIERAFAWDPTNESLLTIKSFCLSQMGRPEDAILALEAAYQLKPDSPLIQNDLGYLYADNGIHLGKAEKLIRSALLEQPANVACQDSLAWVFYKKGKFEEAWRILGRALESQALHSRDPEILDHAGDTLWRLGRKDKAVELWREALGQAGESKIPSPGTAKTVELVSKKLQAVEAGEAPPLAPLAKEPPIQTPDDGK